VTAVDLAVAPQTERFRNIAETQSQRVTCLLYFHWLKSPEKRTIYVPERHRPIVSAIYENLECAISFGDGGVALGHGTLAVRIATGAARAVMRAEQLGNDTVRSICHAKRELVERSHAEVIYAELPLEHPAASQLAEDLENEGFGFLGVAPCFSTCGDLLRLAYLVKPLEREPIKTFEEFAAHLVDYTLAEQARVRQSL
jgi:hypothetical protein